MEKKRLGAKKLKELSGRWADIKEKQSELRKEEAEIKAMLEGHLAAVETDSVAVGPYTVGTKVSSCALESTKKGVKVSEAKRDLAKKLLEQGKDNLLTVGLKMPLLHELQNEKDKETLELLKGLGVTVVEKKTIELRK